MIYCRFPSTPAATDAGQTTAAAGTGQDAFNFATSSNDVGGPVETQESLFEQQVTFPQDSNDDFFNAFGGTTEAQSNRKGTTGAAFDAFAGDTPTASSNSTAGIGDSFAWAGSQTDVKADSEDVNTFFGQPFSDDKQESGVDDIDALFGNVAIQGHGQNAKSDFDPFSQTVDFNAVPSQKPAAPTAPSMEDIFGIDENVADADVWGSLT